MTSPVRVRRIPIPIRIVLSCTLLAVASAATLAWVSGDDLEIGFEGGRIGGVFETDGNALFAVGWNPSRPVVPRPHPFVRFDRGWSMSLGFYGCILYHGHRFDGFGVSAWDAPADPREVITSARVLMVPCWLIIVVSSVEPGWRGYSWVRRRRKAAVDPTRVTAP